LLNRYGNSLVKALQTIYPEQDWSLMYKARGYWNNQENHRKFFDDYALKNGIVKFEDWYNVTHKDLIRSGGGTILKKNGDSLHKALKTIYPEHKGWSAHQFKALWHFSKSQYQLFNVLKNFFPTQSMQTNYKHPNLKYADSDKQMELDIYLPAESIAFEYQGKQHYDIDQFLTNRLMKQRDEEKRRKCKQLGIQLIEIPHWWNGKKETLLDIVQLQKPEVQLVPLTTDQSRKDN